MPCMDMEKTELCDCLGARHTSHACLLFSVFQLPCSRLYIPAVIADGFVDMINPRPFLVRRFISSSKMQSDGMPLTPHASESARFASFASKESAGKDIDAAYESNDA